MKNKGFTLIELLVVTAVIALLASIVLTSLSEAKTEAEDKNKIQEAKQVNNAIAIHRTSNGSAPQGSISSSNSYVAYNEKSSEYQQAMKELVDSGSISEIPRSQNGQDYYYLIDDSNNGVFGAVLRSDSEISNNNGCYFTDPEYGCSGDNASYETEFDRDSLIAEGSGGGSGEVAVVSGVWTGSMYNGLEWSEVAPDTLDWDEAVAYCINEGGRLPAAAEIIVALTAQFGGSEENLGFSDAFSETYWSISEGIEYDINFTEIVVGKVVEWFLGSTGEYPDDKFQDHHVRCVR